MSTLDALDRLTCFTSDPPPHTHPSRPSAPVAKQPVSGVLMSVTNVQWPLTSESSAPMDRPMAHSGGVKSDHYSPPASLPSDCQAPGSLMVFNRCFTFPWLLSPLSSNLSDRHRQVPGSSLVLTPLPLTPPTTYPDRHQVPGSWCPPSETWRGRSSGS